MLFPYQETGARWLTQKKTALLADEMGLGKTAQAIRACDQIGAKRVLVLCPAIARTNWLREFRKFSKISRDMTAITTGSQQPGSHGCVVASYDLALRSSPNWKNAWDCLILDEVHYLKSVEAKRSHVVLGKNGLVHKAGRIWALSGTPAPNHAGELWPLLKIFGATGLPYEDFIARYCDSYDSGFGIKIAGTKRAMIPELKGILSRVMLRRRKTEVLKDLPPIFFSTTVVEPGRVDVEIELAKLEYDKARLIAAMNLADHEVMGALEGLAGSVSSLRRYVGLQKIEPAAELVKEELELELYEKIVIFAVHRDVVAGLEARLRSFGVVTVTGSTSITERQNAVDRFQEPKSGIRVFIGNIQAAGTNLTLTVAHHVLFAEQDWVPGNNLQAAMRCHRIGQTRPVTVRFLSLINSLDERIAEILSRKTRELTEVFDS